MSNHSPITPPDELFNQWFDNWRKNEKLQIIGFDFYIATQAAQWGADQELEACIEWVSIQLNCTDQEHLIPHLRAARRPEPLSLKEKALNTLDEMSNCMGAGFIPKRSDLDTIRTALEALPND